MKKSDITRKIINSICMLLCTFTLAMLITFWVDGDEASKEVPSPLPTPEATQEIAQNGFTIVIDAGHGGKDCGAVSPGGTIESALNLEVAKELEQILTKTGFKIIMTRTDENALGSTKSEDMKKRKEIMNTPHVDAVVSVHMNKFSDSSVSGPMVFYMQGSEAGQKLAECAIESICTRLERPTRSANPGDYFVIRESEAPAIIVECGFLSNSEDERLLLTKEHRLCLAEGIADGVSKFFS